MKLRRSTFRLLMAATIVLALVGCRHQVPQPSSADAVGEAAGQPGEYAVTAQFYDVMAETYWEEKLGPAVARTLRGFDPSAGPIIDVGAGTGLSTAAILRSVPHAHVLAIEPDPAMRAALMTRVMSDEVLRKQVSIIPAGLFEAELPPRISAAVAMSVIHHFTPQQRRRFWTLLAERLAPGGLALIEIQLPNNEPVPLTRSALSRVGDVVYESWMQATPIGPNLQRWRMRYRAFRDGRLIDDQSTTYDMHVVGFDEAIEEITAAGLEYTRDGDFLIVRRGPQRQANVQ